MIDFLDDERALLGERLEAVAGLAHLGLGPVMGALQGTRGEGGGDRGAEQREEVLARFLNDIIGGAGLQRRDRDAALRLARHIDDRRRVRHRVDLGHDLEAGAARHVMVERDHVDAAGAQPRQAGFAIAGRFDAIAMARQVLVGQPAQSCIVVDIKDDRLTTHHLASGTLITEKKRPS